MWVKELIDAHPRGGAAESPVIPSSTSPLAAVAQTQEEIHRRLLEVTPAASDELEAAWRAEAETCLREPVESAPAVSPRPEQFLVLITCRDEKEQVEFLERFQEEGLECRALVA